MGQMFNLAIMTRNKQHLSVLVPFLQELWNEWPMMNEKDVRSVLGRFLFTGEDVEKPVTSLSGGEKARLSLAKLMLQKSNTLILDEPTNHLDLIVRKFLKMHWMISLAQSSSCRMTVTSSTALRQK